MSPRWCWVCGFGSDFVKRVDRIDYFVCEPCALLDVDFRDYKNGGMDKFLAIEQYYRLGCFRCE
jgi:hypothetical protein